MHDGGVFATENWYAYTCSGMVWYVIAIGANFWAFKFV